MQARGFPNTNPDIQTYSISLSYSLVHASFIHFKSPHFILNPLTPVHQPLQLSYNFTFVFCLDLTKLTKGFSQNLAHSPSRSYYVHSKKKILLASSLLFYVIFLLREAKIGTIILCTEYLLPLVIVYGQHLDKQQLHRLVNKHIYNLKSS